MHVEFTHNKAIIKWEPRVGTAELFRSGAPHDGFEKVDNIDLEEGEYVDDFPIDGNNYLYYKIDNKLVHINEKPNRYAQEIVRRDRWFLQKKRYSGGTEATLLIKKIEPPNCPTCYDEELDKVVRSNCKECNGTGIVEPYYRPLQIFIDVRPSRNTIRYEFEKVTTKSYQNSFWTTNLPLLKPNDIIIFNGTRYRVLGDLTYSRSGTYITKQQVPIEAIDDHMKAYEIDEEDVLSWERFENEYIR